MEFRVAYDLKGDKKHHVAIVSDIHVDSTVSGFSRAIQEARKFVLEEFKSQRIVRALAVIDCTKLPGNKKTTPSLRTI